MSLRDLLESKRYFLKSTQWIEAGIWRDAWQAGYSQKQANCASTIEKARSYQLDADSFRQQVADLAEARNRRFRSGLPSRRPRKSFTLPSIFRNERTWTEEQFH